ncbi:MAG: hypothetical protein M1828_000732 [Chrysothrix sp. TS-e1954]|nr:MAG: hypothetical protein M1828_000732 [Chrysothrix sp. TS-e1954]
MAFRGQSDRSSNDSPHVEDSSSSNGKRGIVPATADPEGHLSTDNHSCESASTETENIPRPGDLARAPPLQLEPITEGSWLRNDTGDGTVKDSTNTSEDVTMTGQPDVTQPAEGSSATSPASPEEGANDVYILGSSPSDTTDKSYITAESGGCDGSSEYIDDPGLESPPLIDRSGPSTPPPPPPKSTPHRAFKPIVPGPFSTGRAAHPLSQSVGQQRGSNDMSTGTASRSHHSSGSSIKTAKPDGTLGDHPTSKHDHLNSPAIKKWMIKPHPVRFYHSVFHVLGVINKGSMKTLQSPKSPHHRRSESDAAAEKSLCELLTDAIVRMRWVDERKFTGNDGLEEGKRGWPGRKVSPQDIETGLAALNTEEKDFAITDKRLEHEDAKRTKHTADSSPTKSRAISAVHAAEPAPTFPLPNTPAQQAESGTSHSVYQVDADVQRDVFGFADAEDAVMVIRQQTASWFGDMAVGLVESPVGLEAKDPSFSSSEGVMKIL